MFDSCTSLKNLNVSHFNTSNVLSMENMFNSCISLTSLYVSNFNSSKVTDMSFMFSGCRSLTSLDLRNLDTSRVTNMSCMFAGCYGLERIYAGNWNISNGDNMFKTCNLLTGSQGTKIGKNLYGYDQNGNPLFYDCPDDGSAAHIDGGKDNPGLFSAK